jgi:hypothetical protein
MGTVIELRAWRERRGAPGDPDPSSVDTSEVELARLEAAVQRLHAEIQRWRQGADRTGHSEVETELLAIIGAVGVGSIAVATERAEQLRAALGAPTPTRGRRPSA